MTLCVKTLSIMTFSLLGSEYDIQHERRVECRIFIVMLSVIMLNVIILAVMAFCTNGAMTLRAKTLSITTFSLFGSEYDIQHERWSA
jgi:hypothetical protein